MTLPNYVRENEKKSRNEIICLECVKLLMKSKNHKVLKDLIDDHIISPELKLYIANYFVEVGIEQEVVTGLCLQLLKSLQATIKKKVETIDHDEKRMVKEDSSDSYFEDVNVNEEALRRAFDTSSNWEDD